MELEAAKMIGAGLAAIALAGAGVGIGIIFGNYLSGAMRNPSAAQKQFPNIIPIPTPAPAKAIAAKPAPIIFAASNSIISSFFLMV